MKFRMNKTIGKVQFTFEDEADSHLEFFQKASFYSDLPSVCGACKSDNIILEYRQPQGFTYADMFCLDCKKKLSFGQNKEPKGSSFRNGKKVGNLFPFKIKNDSAFIKSRYMVGSFPLGSFYY